MSYYIQSASNHAWFHLLMLSCWFRNVVILILYIYIYIYIYIYKFRVNYHLSVKKWQNFSVLVHSSVSRISISLFPLTSKNDASLNTSISFNKQVQFSFDSNFLALKARNLILKFTNRDPMENFEKCLYKYINKYIYMHIYTQVHFNLLLFKLSKIVSPWK